MTSYKNDTDLCFDISSALQKDICCTTTASEQSLDTESMESQGATLEKDREESSRYIPFDGQSSDSESMESQDAYIEKDLYDREESRIYMKFNNSVKRPFDGPAYLVGKATSGTNYIHIKMSEDDILLHLTMARFVTTLSKK